MGDYAGHGPSGKVVAEDEGGAAGAYAHRHAARNKRCSGAGSSEPGRSLDADCRKKQAGKRANCETLRKWKKPFTLRVVSLHESAHMAEPPHMFRVRGPDSGRTNLTHISADDHAAAAVLHLGHKYLHRPITFQQIEAAICREHAPWPSGETNLLEAPPPQPPTAAALPVASLPPASASHIRRRAPSPRSVKFSPAVIKSVCD